MSDQNIDWLPIVDGHTMVGVVTPADLFRAAQRPAGLTGAPPDASAPKSPTRNTLPLEHPEDPPP